MSYLDVLKIEIVKELWQNLMLAAFIGAVAATLITRRFLRFELRLLKQETELHKQAVGIMLSLSKHGERLGILPPGEWTETVEGLWKLDHKDIQELRGRLEALTPERVRKMQEKIAKLGSVNMQKPDGPLL